MTLLQSSGRCRTNERGVALLLVLVLVVLVSAIGATVSIGTRTETLIAANFRAGRELLYVADGALALAERDLSRLPEWTSVLSGSATSAFTDGAAVGSRVTPGGERIVLCCGGGSLTGDVQQRALAGRRWGADTPQWQLFAWGPASRWLPAGRIDSVAYAAVWVADDPADGDGNPLADANGTLELFAQALGAAGGRRVIESTIRRQIGPGGTPGPGVRVLSWREVRW